MSNTITPTVFYRTLNVKGLERHIARLGRWALARRHLQGALWNFLWVPAL